MRVTQLAALYKKLCSISMHGSGVSPRMFFSSAPPDKNWERITKNMTPIEKYIVAVESPADEDYREPSFSLLRAIGFFSADQVDAGLYNLELAKKLDGREVEKIAHKIYESHKTGFLTKESEIEKITSEVDRLLTLK